MHCQGGLPWDQYEARIHIVLHRHPPSCTFNICSFIPSEDLSLIAAELLPHIENILAERCGKRRKSGARCIYIYMHVFVGLCVHFDKRRVCGGERVTILPSITPTV